MSNTEAADWYPDPVGRFEFRWWDGSNWTGSVSSGGQVTQDPLDPAGPVTSSADSAVPGVPGPTGQPRAPGAADQTGYVPVGTADPGKIQAQMAKAADAQQGAPASPAGHDLLSEPILVVNQKAKLIEINNEYAVYNSAGQQIGGIRQVGQSKLKKFVRVVADVDQYLTHQLEIVDLNGRRLLHIKRPAKVFKSKFEITGPSGGVVGQIVQKNMIGKIRFGLIVNGQEIGSINAENWRAWNFSIRDASENEIARITKTWEGLAKTMFTSADNYVVHIHAPLTEPLRSMVVASALSIDTALKQDKRGFN
jgi:uncharacterized protein YxjI